MTDLQALIERLEKATEGSRELDVEIWWQAYRVAATRAYWNGALGTPHPLDDAMPKSGLGYHAMIASAPYYTTSLDAALTLVGEEDIDEYELWNDCGSWFTKMITLVGWVGLIVTRSDSGASEPALEFCAIFFKHLRALKARQAAEKETM